MRLRCGSCGALFESHEIRDLCDEAMEFMLASIPVNRL